MDVVGNMVFVVYLTDFIVVLCQWAPRLDTDSSQSLLWINWTASMREVGNKLISITLSVLKRQNIHVCVCVDYGKNL